MRVASLCQIIFFEMIAMSCFASLVADFIVHYGWWQVCEPFATLGGTDIASFILGSLCVWAVVKGMVMPTFRKVSFRPSMRVGSIVATNPFLGQSTYFFPSTHPSYILVDVGAIVFGAFFYWVGNYPPATAGCAFEYQYLFGRFMLYGAFIFPLVRLGMWYIARKKLPAEQTAGAFIPVIIFSVILWGALIGSLVWAKMIGN